MDQPAPIRRPTEANALVPRCVFLLGLRRTEPAREAAGLRLAEPRAVEDLRDAEVRAAAAEPLRLAARDVRDDAPRAAEAERARVRDVEAFELDPRALVFPAIQVRLDATTPSGPSTTHATPVHVL
ncbi:hypothetical protein [Rhodococcus spongiicola]|nr:hypothetical protein [Rhodococcus spongiicola]